MNRSIPNNNAKEQQPNSTITNTPKQQQFSKATKLFLGINEHSFGNPF